MTVIWKHLVSGHPSAVVDEIIRLVSGLTRGDSFSRFKIGRTSDPEGRFAKKDYNIYDEMVVVYRTDSVDNVDLMEALLVEHNEEWADNEVAGGGGPLGDAPYFVYVVRKLR